MENFLVLPLVGGLGVGWGYVSNQQASTSKLKALLAIILNSWIRPRKPRKGGFWNWVAYVLLQCLTLYCFLSKVFDMKAFVSIDFGVKINIGRLFLSDFAWLSLLVYCFMEFWVCSQQCNWLYFTWIVSVAIRATMFCTLENPDAIPSCKYASPTWTRSRSSC